VRKTSVLFMTLSLALLAGCSKAPMPLTASVEAASSAEAEAAGSLSTKVKARFKAFFNKLDANNDKKWTKDDFKMQADRFHKAFGGIDTSNDEAVSFEEYWPKERHDELIEDIQARATVFALQSGGKTTYDDAFPLLFAYLKGDLPKAQRQSETDDAFKTADSNHDKVLNKTELGYAIGIMEAKAYEHYIEVKVNRSNGQPDNPEHPINKK
jgi:hypothetical protein